MQVYDNRKLIAYLEEHGIEVLSCTPYAILCNTLYGDGSRVAEEVAASMPAVRAYLGY